MMAQQSKNSKGKGVAQYGFVYVADMKMAPSLLFSVWSLRKTNPTIPVTVISINLNATVKQLLFTVHATVEESTFDYPSEQYGQKKLLFLHRYYQTTWCIDADTVFLKKIEENLWQVPPHTIRILRVPWSAYSFEKLKKVYEALPSGTRRCFPFPTETQYNPIAVQSGSFLFTETVQPILETFFSSISTHIWKMVSGKEHLGGDESLLHFVCYSRHIHIEELERQYNFIAHFHNRKKIFYGKNIEKTLENAFSAAVLWDAAIILHYNDRVWLKNYPPHLLLLGAIRAICNLLDKKAGGWFSKTEFCNWLSAVDPKLVATIFETALPLPTISFEERMWVFCRKKIQKIRAVITQVAKFVRMHNINN